MVSEAEKIELFSQLRAEFSEDQIHELGFKGEPTDAVLQRFSQARKFHKDKVVAMMNEALAFRKETNPNDLMRRGKDACLGCPSEEVLQFYSGAYVNGCDKQGRPIWYERTGKIDIHAMHALTDNDKFMDYHLCLMEELGYKYEETSKTQGRYVNNTFSILDLEGVTMSKLGKETMQVIKRLTSTDSLIYPETMGKMFIINSPTIFSAAWSVIQGFLDPRTKSKITLCGKESTWKHKILEYIDEDVLPQELGGKGPNCLPETQCFTEVSLSSSHSRATAKVELKKGEKSIYKYFTRNGSVHFGSSFNGKVVDAAREVSSSECAHGSSVSGSFEAPVDGTFEMFLEHKGWFSRHALYRLYKDVPPVVEEEEKKVVEVAEAPKPVPDPEPIPDKVEENPEPPSAQEATTEDANTKSDAKEEPEVDDNEPVSNPDELAVKEVAEELTNAVISSVENSKIQEDTSEPTSQVQ